MDAVLIMILVFVFLGICRLGDIRDELGRIRRLLEQMEEQT